MFQPFADLKLADPFLFPLPAHLNIQVVMQPEDFLDEGCINAVSLDILALAECGGMEGFQSDVDDEISVVRSS